MPNFWTHWICANVMLEQLEGRAAAGIIKRNPISYRLGSQGADLLYFRPTQYILGRRGAVHYGRLLHDQPVDKLAALGFEHLRESASEGAIAYICGFLNHHAVDEAVHGLMDRYAAGPLRHRRIELDLDAYAAGKLEMLPGAKARTGLKDFHGMSGLSRWYNYLLGALCGSRFSPRSYRKDYRAMRRVSRIINRPRRLVKRKYADRPVLSRRELEALLAAALRGSAKAGTLAYGLIDRLASTVPGGILEPAPGLA